MAQNMFFIAFIILILTVSVSFAAVNETLISNHPQKITSPQPQTPQPTVEKPFGLYAVPELPQKKEYTIVMLGDSMTHALGPHGGKFYEYINEKYKTHSKGIVIENYANPSTNVLSLSDAMNKKVTYWDWTFEPMLSRKFDLVLIESFGYNPLSQFSLDSGLGWQEKALDKTIKTLRNSHPKARIAFVATIAPNKTKFALPVDPQTSLQDRTAMVEERASYIKNHIAYAQEHNIPIINIYDKSLTQAGDGKLEYINPDDYIHPSALGLEFIGHELADFIYNNELIPH